MHRARTVQSVKNAMNHTGALRIECIEENKRNIMKAYAETFYKSQAWKKMRDYCFKRDVGLCQDCLKDGKIVSAEEVHHIIPITTQNIDDESITLNETNLVSLCRECHKSRHTGRKRRFQIDENGHVVVL